MVFKTYYPMPKFPPISLSGTACQLRCQHCDATYLRGMLAADTPEALLSTCKTLSQKGAVGALLSGGSDREGGILNLKTMLGAIQRIKQETSLILNLHPGLLDKATAEGLRVDFASLEIPAQDVITNVFRLDARTEDYVATYDRLREAGIEVVPHISVYAGGEHALLRAVHAPNVIVVIVFSPTRHTGMSDEAPPAPSMVADVIRNVSAMFPKAEISLGCMRPRDKGLREEIELAALDAGASRMELPSRKTLAYARERGYTIQGFDACCALPLAYEALAVRS